jgi:hypothetical protein
MTIQDWGALGEVAGGLAVIITLIYLIVQLKHNARATHRQTYNAAAEAVSRFSMELARDSSLNQVYRATLRSPLSDEDRTQGFAVLDAYFTLMESYYLHNTAFGEKLSQERWARTMGRILATPGGNRYWPARAWQFHDEFAAYVRGLIVEPQAAETEK